MMVLTNKPEVGQTDAALLDKELTQIYSTPTPKGWPEPKKGKLYLIDWMSFTIARVQYLYPEPKHRHSKRADSSVASESADIDPHAIDSLIDTILEASSSRVLLPKF